MKPIRNSYRIAVLIPALLLFLQACTILPAYDQATVDRLEATRTEVLKLYDTFTGSQVNDEEIAAVRQQLVDLQSYEADKGQANKLMTVQIGYVLEMFDRHVENRKEQGRWSATNKNNKKELIAAAFEQAVRTEQEKNR